MNFWIIKLVGYLAAYRTVRSNQPWHCTHCTYSFRLSFGKLVPLLRKLSWDVLIFIGSGFVTKFSLLCMSSLVTDTGWCSWCFCSFEAQVFLKLGLGFTWSTFLHQSFCHMITSDIFCIESIMLLQSFKRDQNQIQWQ